MGFWKDLFLKAKNTLAEDDTYQDEVEAYIIDSKDVNLRDEYERRRYIESLLDQVADATGQVDELNSEYKTINNYLKDVEELEFIHGEDKRKLIEYAKAIVHLSTDKQRYEERRDRMSDEDYDRMDRLYDESDEGARKLREAEQYRELIRGDLRRLEGEKQACIFRKEESDARMNNLRGMAQITLITVAALFLILSVMQFGFEMNARVGFFITAAAGAISLTAVYMMYLDARKEKVRASRSLNKVILLQNRVKIRYVNNANLLDYLYMKFGISKAEDLEQLRNKYMEEKAEREKIREDMKELT
ncbi:MAG: hypothetical protein J5842_03420, partial [Lachnospiraceae bacterium]|nr:hypothetical protein [Lachnospiraceae bacterium]